MDDVGCFSSQPSPLKQLLDHLEHLITTHAQTSGNPWISAAELSDLFFSKSGRSLEALVEHYGGGDLRRLLTQSKRFAIYNTQLSHNFYIAPWYRVGSPAHPQRASHPIQYRVKRPWKVDGRLIQMLEAEGAERISHHRQPRIPTIQSVDDLKTALIEIVRSLIADQSTSFVTLARLSQVFYARYRQPIRAAIHSLCPGIKLIDLLQSIPTLDVQQTEQRWHVAIQEHSSGPCDGRTDP